MAMKTANGPIKVAHIVTRMNTGGVAVLIAEIFKGYDQSVFNFTLITGACQGGEEDYLQAHGLKLNEIEVSDMSRSLNPLKDLTAFFSIIRTLNRLKPDIVHTHTSKAGLLGRIAAKTACPKAKVVHTYHGHLLQGYFSKLTTKLVVLTEKYLARISDVLVSMGNHVKKELLAAGVGHESQYEVLLPGVAASDAIVSSPEVSAFKSKHADELICTFVGRLSMIKRCDRIVELAKMAELQDQSIHFLIIGDGELRSELEINSNNLPISFLGWQSNSAQWLAISDIAILLSDNEAVPLAMIEAGLAGLPVVATNVGSMSDVVIDGVNGFLTSTKVDEIGAALLMLAQRPELRLEMGAAGRSRARSRFSTQAMISAHQDIYSQLGLRNN
jgi:glycosyltransferase involved in cell wall biosynthesis